MPDPSSTHDCPVTKITAKVTSRTHAVVKLFRCVRLGAGMGAFVALTLVSEDKSWCRAFRYNGGTAALDVGALRLVWDVTLVLGLATWAAAVCERRGGVACVLRAASLSPSLP
eukprot:4866882-Pleurochrysis_carterae.AAC.4